MTVGYQRLLQLADHLQFGKLSHDYFNFACFHSESVCGTAGCALGECPFLWPEAWEMYQSDRHRHLGVKPKLRNITLDESWWSLVERSVVEWFEIAPLEFRLLFCPQAEIAPWNQSALGIDATSLQVAESIRSFVAWKIK